MPFQLDSPRKRQRRDSNDSALESEPLIGQSTNFRNISACSRCRSRKNRCDQRLPSCSGCAKAGVACVGYDVLTKRETPRSYVYYLEKRVEQLEKLLVTNKVSFPPADDLDAYCKGEPSMEEPIPIPKSSHKLLSIGEGAPFMSTVFNALSPASEETADSDPVSALPSRALGTQLVEAYFERVNPQLPIVSRRDFLRIFDAAYAGDILSPSEWYYIYMIFAIGHGHGFIDGDDADKDVSHEYYTVASSYFEACINSADKLEVLRAILLLCSYALLRPVGPGVWYLAGIAMRLAVDLGLHQEAPREHAPSPVAEDDTIDHVRNTKRRLWWSTYSLDRLVSVSVGRPFSISDQDISTPMPTETPQSPDVVPMRCDQVAQHFIRLRILQSQVLARKKGSQNRLHTQTKDGTHISPWVQELEQRLNNWRLAAPAKDTTGVAFPKAMVEFYYWQSIIVLYQRCVSTNDLLGEIRTVKADGASELPDHEDTRYLKVAEAGQKLLRMYRQRHLAGCIKYTYSSAYYLLRVCILYLHAVAVSQAVRSRFDPDDIDFTVLAARSIFSDVVDTCPEAKTWIQTLEKTAKIITRIAANASAPTLSSDLGQFTSPSSLGDLDMQYDLDTIWGLDQIASEGPKFENLAMDQWLM